MFILASKLPTPCVKDLTECNVAFKRLQATADVPIKILPIPLERLVGVVFTDASLGNAKDGHSQLAWLACVADQDIAVGKESDMSILCWKSNKMTRSASNVLFTESNALSDGLAFMEWLSAWIGLAKDLHHDIRKRNPVSYTHLTLPTILRV